MTYRPPDQAQVKNLTADGMIDDDAMDEGVIAAFYKDIQRNFGGQVIVMENIDPPIALDRESTDIPFTKLATSGRYGFFPITETVR